MKPQETNVVTALEVCVKGEAGYFTAADEGRLAEGATVRAVDVNIYLRCAAQIVSAAKRSRMVWRVELLRLRGRASGAEM